MKIRIHDNYFVNVIGVDNEAQIFQVQDTDEDFDDGENKYLRVGSNAIYEGSPPTCKECEKQNSLCTNECYIFTTPCGEQSKKTLNCHLRQVTNRTRKNHEELQKIIDMKNKGRKYASWLEKSLFTSKNNQK